MQQEQHKKNSYHHGNLRPELLTAARFLLEEVSSDGMCLREIARRAGVSHAAPYRHFSSKKDLLKTLTIEGLIQLKKEREQKLLEITEPKEKLFVTMKNYVEFGLNFPELHELIFGPKSLRYSDKEVQTVFDQSYDDWLDIVNSAMPSTKKKSAKYVSQAIWFYAHGVLLLSPRTRISDSKEGDGKSIEGSKAIIDSLRFGIEALLSGCVGGKWENPYLF